MQQFYGVNIDDVWAGRQPVGHVLVLAEHLKLNPRSRVYALHRGDIGFMGWDPAAEILANQYDQFGALMAGLSGEKHIDPARLYPRPGEEQSQAAGEQEPIVPTIAEFSAATFTRFMYGTG